MRVARVAALFGRGGRTLTDPEAEALLQAGAAQQVDRMLTHTAVGTPAEVRDTLATFAKYADADELITVHQSSTVEGRLASVRLTAEAMA